MAVFPAVRLLLRQYNHVSITCSIVAHNIDSLVHNHLREWTFSSKDERFQIELFHEQLPLPVPCYDLLPVDELTVEPLA